MRPRWQRVCSIAVAALLIVPAALVPLSLILMQAPLVPLPVLFYHVPLALASGNLLLALTTGRTGVKVLSLLSILLCVATGSLVLVSTTAPSVEFHPRAMAGICAILGGYPVVVILSVIALVLSIQGGRERTGKAGCCTKCGSDLQGLPEPRCPECGTPFGSRPDDG